MTENPDRDESGKMLVCSHCPKEFRYNSEKIRHEMSHSPGFQCEVCSKKFSFISALRRHQKQHERTGSVKCALCNRQFRDEVLLKRHMKYSHKGTFTCTKCSSQFSSDQALQSHMKSHKPQSERRFKCAFEGCAKSFNFSHHLKHHELTHTNEKQHFCSVCGKGFIQSHHLKTHLKSHDPSEWLMCEFDGCLKKFSTEYARKRHMTTHRLKPDSGISSDSSSCDAVISSETCGEDSILCANCGENVLHSEYINHSAECGNDCNNSVLSFESSTTEALKYEFEQTLSLESLKTDTGMKSDVDTEIDIESYYEKNAILKEIQSKPIFDKDIGDCKTAPGGCIMGPEHCVCVERSRPIDIIDDVTPIENSEAKTSLDNIPDFKTKLSIVNVLKSLEYNNNNIGLRNNITNKINGNNMSSMVCEGCDCATSCDAKPKNGNSNNYNEVLTNVEYGVDGVVKIKDTFDIDIMPIKSVYKSDNISRFVPFSTCRDVIGNCIAGGSDGCLCAKMMMDSQQSMAQEIDDITPNPKTELILNL